MGVDAGIFAKKAKKYFWFDRLSNIHEYWNLPDDLYKKEYDDIYYKLVNERNGKYSETLELLSASSKAWDFAEPSRQYHKGWVEDCIKFINAFPDDEFFVASDNDDVHELIKNMNGNSKPWGGEYDEWVPKDVGD